MDGWTARVNGSPSTIHHANFAFRAVEVPAGPVVIELSYWPPGLSSGLVISLASLTFLVAAALWWGRVTWLGRGAS